MSRDPIVQLADDALRASTYLDSPATENWSHEKLETESDRVTAIIVRALQTPATSLEGVLAKLRLAHRIETFDPALDDVKPDCGRLDAGAIFWAIRRDLEALAGEDAS